MKLNKRLDNQLPYRSRILELPPGLSVKIYDISIMLLAKRSHL